jgi:hypothetical protein
MRRNQREHAIRTACQIIGRPAVIVVGSQSILGTFREDQLPAEATMSAEIDILPIADNNDETARLADIIEGVAGELSSFEELHGFSIDALRTGNLSTPGGASTRKTCASPSSAHSGKRTGTLSRPSLVPSSSTARSFSPA